MTGHWYKGKMAELRESFGNTCWWCGVPLVITDGVPNLQFCHLVPTGLKGKSRGRSNRYRDILNNQDKYRLGCFNCHTFYDLITEDSSVLLSVVMANLLDQARSIPGRAVHHAFSDVTATIRVDEFKLVTHVGIYGADGVDLNFGLFRIFLREIVEQESIREEWCTRKVMGTRHWIYTAIP